MPHNTTPWSIINNTTSRITNPMTRKNEDSNDQHTQNQHTFNNRIAKINAIKINTIKYNKKTTKHR